MRRLALMLGALTVATACDNMLTRPTLYSRVDVVATRRNGDPVPGVKIELYSGQRPMAYAATDSNGRFTFTNVPQGQYGVVAYELPPQYDLVEHLLGGNPTNVVDRLHVTPDSAPSARFVLLKRGPGTIAVRVVDGSGATLSNVPIELYSPASSVAKTKTDSAGRVTFNAVPYGQYGVIATRPFFYRDFVRPLDSAYAVRDRLLVEDGARDSLTIVLPKCAGTLRVTARDDAGAPVPLSTIAVYTPTDRLGLQATAADGHTDFAAPCVYPLGVYINPAAGYTVAEGRGSSFIDGVTVGNAKTVDVVFRLHRQR